MKIPVSVIVVTKNEERRIEQCLAALQDFSELIVVDSNSTDKTQELAQAQNARVVNFEWGGTYPKKRQWSLDIIDLAHDWVFFVDADEIVTSNLIEEIRTLQLSDDTTHAGYFVKGQYIFDGAPLNFGLKNNKLVLLNRRKVEFPVVDDLDIPGMGEMEGHYQPVLKQGFQSETIGQLQSPLHHEAYDDPKAWQARHERYAQWEREMDKRRAWPVEDGMIRQFGKTLFKALPFRGFIAFLHSYVWKLGFLDGARGRSFALSRKHYYDLI